MIFSILLFVFVVLTGFSTMDINQSTVGLIEWIEQHSVTVAAFGIVVSIILFMLQQHLSHIKEIRRHAEQKFNFFYSMYYEAIDRKALMEKQRIVEYETEFFDFEFPDQIYSNFSTEIHQGTYQQSIQIILDFYNKLKERNKIYRYRIETKINNIRDPNQYVIEFISNTNKKIQEYEEMLIESNEQIIEMLKANLDIAEKNKNSLKTKIGFRFGV